MTEMKQLKILWTEKAWTCGQVRSFLDRAYLNLIAVAMNVMHGHWSGVCGTGKGADTFTSGFEFPWNSHVSIPDNVRKC